MQLQLHKKQTFSKPSVTRDTEIWTTSWFIICKSKSWSRSSDEEEEVGSPEEGEEEEEFCRMWRVKLTILVALWSMFLLADLLIAAEI